jgi:BirA family biotin operon repressor/biotin-[acetyl-CoA-carboxylase] ligase
MHYELLKLLADGKFHSGEMLAASLNVSRTAIWKMIPYLRDLGLELHSVKGKGYRLLEALDLLDEERLKHFLSIGVRGKLSQLEIFPSIPSTSSYLMAKVQDGTLDLAKGKVVVCLAEQQSAGRGRRGRLWVSPFGHNLYLTIAREFSQGISELEGLSLVMGLSLIRVLKRNGFDELGIKWPNDVLWRGKKLAGILLEISGDPTGLTQVLIGLGLNIKVSGKDMDEVDQAWTDLYSIKSNLPERNKLAAEIIAEIMTTIADFEKLGFSSFRQEWDGLDALKHQQVALRTRMQVSTAREGIVRGVDEHGALLLETISGLQTFHGGEVSPRVVHDGST